MRLKFSVFSCLVFLFLTGWGHIGQVKIGFAIDHTQGREPFLKFIQEAMKDNHANLMLKDAGNDPVTQENQVKDLIHQGIQALVVIPCDPSKSLPLVALARQAGIKVISLEHLIPDSELDYYIDFSAVKAGGLQAQAMVKRVPKGRYVLLGKDPVTEGSKNFRDGQMKVLQPLIDRGDIQIVASQDSTVSSVETVVESILVREANKVDAILASESSLAEGAVQALEKEKLSEKVSVAGMGDDLATCRRIVSGTQTLTVYLPPQKLAEETAYLAAKLARKATEFDCQFVEVANGHRLVHAVLLTPVVADAGNLDSTIINDQVQKKEDVYVK